MICAIFSSQNATICLFKNIKFTISVYTYMEKKRRIMKNNSTNIFIIDDDVNNLARVKQFLEEKFLDAVQISIFTSGEECLPKINQTTQIVILDYALEGKDGLEILKLIKAKNPDTEVIMLTSNENIILAIETFRSGAKDFVIKGKGSMAHLAKLISQIVTAPIRIIVKEFGVSKIVAQFAMSFLTIGIIVLVYFLMI